MLKLLDNNELKNISIFIIWLINISGFFGILSDEKDFFLSSSPYVLTLTLLLLIVNNNSDKKFLIKLSLIFLFFLKKCTNNHRIASNSQKMTPSNAWKIQKVDYLATKVYMISKSLEIMCPPLISKFAIMILITVLKKKTEMTHKPPRI